MPQSVQFQLGGTLRFLVEEEGYAIMTVRYKDFTLTARGDKMAYTLPVDNVIKVKVSYIDAHGNPAVVDGDVAWSTSDATIARVVADTGDTTNASVEAQGKVGQCQVTASADADLGTGVRELITLMDLTVVAGEAVAGTISPVGEPLPPTAQPRR
jgi:nitrogenase molybdenum-iron protein alpha/beta subunit